MSNNPKNQLMNEHQWAEYIALRKSGTTQVPSDQLATPEQVYDLEIDASLRGLAQISNNTDFVNDVMEKVAVSNPKLPANGQVSQVLPTITPAFERNSVQDVSVVPEKCLASTGCENANQTFDPGADHRPFSARPRSLVIAGCLAVAAISAYLLIPARSTDQPQTVESHSSPAPKKFSIRVGNSNDEIDSEDLVSKPIAKATDQLPVVSSVEPVDELAQVEVVQQAKGLAEQTLEDWVGANEPSDARGLATPEKKSQHLIAPSLVSGAQPQTQDRPDTIDAPATDKRIIQSDKKWNLALSLNGEGHGTLTINNELVSDNALVIHSKDVIRGVGNEAAKRLLFLQPEIGKRIGGSVTIWDKRHDFEGPAEIGQTIEAAITQLDVNQPLKAQLATLRDNLGFQQLGPGVTTASKQLETAAMSGDIHEIVKAQKHLSLQMLKAARDRRNSSRPHTFTPQQLERHRMIKQSLFADLRYSPPTDELLVFENAVIQTETFLRELAKEKLHWKTQVNRGKVSKREVAFHTRSQEALANGSQINEADFKNFAILGNQLVPPNEEEEAFKTKPLIQHLSGLELKAQLHANSRSYDLFADVNAFRSAVSFIKPHITDIRSRRNRQKTEPFEPLKDILPDRPDLQGLSLVMGEECRLSEEDAKIQNNVSRGVGSALARFDSFGNRNLGNDTSARRMFVGAEIERCSKNSEEADSSQTLVTLDQMMQIDHTRLVLDVIDNLREANTDTAIELLAKRAKFDLRPEVRFSATQALKDFPSEKSRNVLLAGFEYPWSVVAQHSAEALVRLDDTQAVPELVELLKQHKSLTSFEEDGEFFQKEVVAVNHLRNCLLCHAPSLSQTDSSRGQIPDWERPLSREYYQSSSGTFVRADITYLTQDFSVVQPVEAHGAWPANQRFDYMVYKRPISEKAAAKNDEMDHNKVHREAIVFALESLTGETLEDDSWENWHRIAEDRQ